jgi:hypothetical protein
MSTIPLSAAMPAITTMQAAAANRILEDEELPPDLQSTSETFEDIARLNARAPAEPAVLRSDDHDGRSEGFRQVVFEVKVRKDERGQRHWLARNLKPHYDWVRVDLETARTVVKQAGPPLAVSTYVRFIDRERSPEGGWRYFTREKRVASTGLYDTNELRLWWYGHRAELENESPVEMAMRSDPVAGEG